jgi:ATP adenylyltransferase
MADPVSMADGWERLWTPHRMDYIKSDDTSSSLDGSCPFCAIPDLTADESHVVRRDEFAYAVLNLYPYNPGHLLVCPYRHVADYTDLTEDEVKGVALLTQQAMQCMRDVSSPHGFNIGMNQGEVAGAGIAGHLHQHVVPRWGGDANFMPIIGRTKVLPQLLTDTRTLLSEAWPTSDAPT